MLPDITVTNSRAKKLSIMMVWDVLCVIAGFSIIAWNNETFVHGELHQEQELSQLKFHNAHRKKSPTVDYLGKELQYVAKVYKELQNKSGCNDVAVLNITFDSERWKTEALLAVKVANLLTTLWPVKKSDGESIAENETLLFEIARANVLFSPSVFGSVVCFEPNLFRSSKRFCPYAFKDHKLNGRIHIMDLAQSNDYDYSTSPNAIWWIGIKDKTRNTKLQDSMEAIDFYSIAQGNRSIQNFTRLLVRYEDGLWTRPYYDCFGGKVWMVTFLAPMFNETCELL